MAYNCGILLGRITKVSGYEGAVTVRLERNFSEKLPHMESVFLEIEGRPVPFFISDLDYSGADILKLKFVGYNSPDKVSGFVGSKAFLTNPTLSGGKINDIQSLAGYRVITTDNNLLGTVKEVIQNPGQWILNVISDRGKSILIPLHEDFVVKTDKRKELLIMEIPDGLTEIN